ncbi:hypothetical protein C8Q73DRAFT_108290 [Cubamyces lactineus]|nr:hypothetical protein C8Q73DRAFT_108290 [Cubamyces lactineus]
MRTGGWMTARTQRRSGYTTWTRTYPARPRDGLLWYRLTRRPSSTRLLLAALCGSLFPFAAPASTPTSTRRPVAVPARRPPIHIDVKVKVSICVKPCVAKQVVVLVVFVVSLALVAVSSASMMSVLGLMSVSILAVVFALMGRRRACGGVYVRATVTEGCSRERRAGTRANRDDGAISPGGGNGGGGSVNGSVVRQEEPWHDAALFIKRPQCQSARRRRRKPRFPRVGPRTRGE